MNGDFHDRLVVKLAAIPDEGLEFQEELPREWLTNIPEFSDESGPHLEGRIQVRGKLVREGKNLRLHGEVETGLATFCTRCGEPLLYPIRGQFDLVLVEGAEPELTPELELTPEDLAQGYFSGREVDLAPLFQEQVALETPLQPLCREECKGLCPTCGTNLNRDRCECKPPEGDPRLAALRGLKIED